IELGKNHSVVRIPETQFFALLYRLTFLHLEECTIRHVIADQYPAFLLVDDPDLSGPTHHHMYSLVLSVGRFDDADAFKLDDTGELRPDVRLHGDVRCGTPYVEGTQRKLGSGFTDRLCRDNADRFA